MATGTMKTGLEIAQEAQLRPAERSVRDLERAPAAGGEGYVDREEQVRDQQGHGQPGRHPTRSGQAQEEPESAEGVHHVIDVEAVTWTRALPVAGQCSVEAVAEPVQGEGHVDGQEQPWPA